MGVAELEGKAQKMTGMAMSKVKTWHVCSSGELCY